MLSRRRGRKNISERFSIRLPKNTKKKGLEGSLMGYFETSPCCTEKSLHTPRSVRVCMFAWQQLDQITVFFSCWKPTPSLSTAAVEKGGWMKTIDVLLINLPHLNSSPPLASRSHVTSACCTALHSALVCQEEMVADLRGVLTLQNKIFCCALPSVQYRRQ